MSVPPNNHKRLAEEQRKAAAIKEIAENCYSSVKDPDQRRKYAENALKRGPGSWS